MGGNFQSGRFLFQVEDGDYILGLRELLDDSFDARLASSGRIPDLNGAPIASWALARVRRLTDDGIPPDSKERNDGGGYLLQFVVYAGPEKPVAEFQFQGGMGGVGIVGHRAADCAAEEILGAFATAFLAEPTELMECRYVVIDPEWKLDPDMYTPAPFDGSRNKYGWDGTKFLGKKNVREK